MKHISIIFSLLLIASASQAQFQITSSLPNCSCGSLAMISKPTPISATSTTTNLSWTSSFSYGWHIMYRDAGTSDDFVENAATITNAFSNPRTGTANGLQPGHTYEFYILGTKDCSGDNCTEITASNLSQTLTGVTVFPAVPDPGVSLLTATSFRISWGVTGAADHRVDVAKDAGFTNLVVNNVSTSTATQIDISSLTPGVQYFYRVRGSNAAGTTSYSTTKNTTTLPNVPVLAAATSIGGTSFTANWQAATGATSYNLDVALESSFINFVSGYNSLSVTGTTKSVTGLSEGTVYYYRVRGVDAGGVSAYSATSQQLTLPAAPTFLPVTASIMTTSFVLSNTGVKSATSYELDIALDDQFTEFFSFFNSLSLNGTTITIGFVTPGTVYYARERAVNGSGKSPSSAVVKVTTITLPAVAINATSVGPNGFVANWNAVTSAKSYSLDVATDQAMTNILPGYSDLTVTDIKKEITGLATGSTYYYRVRVNNDGGTSDNSNVVSQLTLPAVPADFAVTDITATTMKAAWSAIPTAVEYDLEVSTTLAFDNIVNGYGPKVISSAITEIVLNENLLPSTVYYLRVRSKNISGFSEYSETRTASTLSGGSDSFDIKLTDVKMPVNVTPGTASSFEFTANGGIGSLHATLFHRKKTEAEFESEAISVIKGINAVIMEDDWFDDIGMECYIEITDDGGHVQRSTTTTVLVHITNVVVPVASFGKDVANYHIISVPYDLATKKIADIFEPIAGLGSYDETRWRLVHYKDGANQDYRDGLSVSNLERGQGYWFISKDDVELSIGPANTFDNSLDNPFKLTLKKGWNQIGNPTGRAIDWSDLTALPENVDVPVGNLLIYANESISLKESDVLRPFEGGFVFADDNTELTFPVTLPTSAGRKQSNANEELLPGDWMLPIQLVQDRLVSDLSGIGMHHNASDETDRFDMPVPPTFARYVEFSSVQNFSRDVVSTKDSYTWSFTLNSDHHNAVTLKWDRSLAVNLIMHDLQNNRLINMSKIDSYVANPFSSFVIYYDRNKKMEETEIHIGVPYPNPFNDNITFISGYEKSIVSLIITDLNGSEIARLSSNDNKIQYNGKDLAPGLYIYRLTTGTSFYTGKIIKQ